MFYPVKQPSPIPSSSSTNEVPSFNGFSKESILYWLSVAGHDRATVDACDLVNSFVKRFVSSLLTDIISNMSHGNRMNRVLLADILTALNSRNQTIYGYGETVVLNSQQYHDTELLTEYNLIFNTSSPLKVNNDGYYLQTKLPTTLLNEEGSSEDESVCEVSSSEEEEEDETIKKPCFATQVAQAQELLNDMCIESKENDDDLDLPFGQEDLSSMEEALTLQKQNTQWKTLDDDHQQYYECNNTEEEGGSTNDSLLLLSRKECRDMCNALLKALFGYDSITFSPAAFAALHSVIQQSVLEELSDDGVTGYKVSKSALEWRVLHEHKMRVLESDESTEVVRRLESEVQKKDQVIKELKIALSNKVMNSEDTISLPVTKKRKLDKENVKQPSRMQSLKRAVMGKGKAVAPSV